MKGGLGGQLGQPRANHDLGAFLGETSNTNFVKNDILSMIKVFGKTMCTHMHWSHITITHSKSHKQFNHIMYTQMTCDHGMMLMSDHDDAYVDAMLMVNMQDNTRSVTDLPPYKKSRPEI